MRPCLITVCSNPDHPGFPRLARSAAKFGWPFEPIITDLFEMVFAEKVQDIIMLKTSFKMKLTAVRDSLPRLKSKGYTHYVFTDAYDTLAEGLFDALEAACAAAGYAGDGAIFGCEKACYPKPELAGMYPPTDSPYKYLNSGGYLSEIDFAGDVLLAGVSSDPDTDSDDQLFMTNRYLVQFLPDALWAQDPILLDHHCHIFQNMAHHAVFGQKWADYFEVRDGRVWNKITGTAPLLWHAAGGGTLDNYHSWLPSFNL